MKNTLERGGPLTGIRVLEFTGIGPGPHCGMQFADLGADVLRVERKGGNGWPNPVADRGRRLVEVDIRSDEGRAFCLDAADGADALIEGFRPGPAFFPHPRDHTGFHGPSSGIKPLGITP
ncbi:MAG: CoA transferase [Desulfovibrio sp.]|nr:CoA transferase [Desulfovibrio sp.]